MKYKELVDCIYCNKIINYDLYKILKDWDYKSEINYSNIKENVRNTLNQTCIIKRPTLCSKWFDFYLETSYNVSLGKPEGYNDFTTFTVPKTKKIYGFIYNEEVLELIVEEHYGTVVIRDGLAEVDKMTDLEMYWEDKAYENWNNNE
jgi:hypothetical protein